MQIKIIIPDIQSEFFIDFDENLIVYELQQNIMQLVNIPIEHQIILIETGENLIQKDQLVKYTEQLKSGIYLLNKLEDKRLINYENIQQFKIKQANEIQFLQQEDQPLNFEEMFKNQTAKELGKIKETEFTLYKQKNLIFEIHQKWQQCYHMLSVEDIYKQVWIQQRSVQVLISHLDFYFKQCFTFRKKLKQHDKYKEKFNIMAQKVDNITIQKIEKDLEEVRISIIAIQYRSASDFKAEQQKLSSRLH